ncbi:HNH endonuclease signature motif containing protein [Corynebacterium heidelbergense]|uniref:HNH endonuclease signature motif containing protein n=1 Tax=Corynebacterium heidelbergense TaxID=2055947 RepID=UPI001057870D|nr:HNH endonuclease signature motif containing protein [Corynebacterium heidelbergense]
MTINRQHLATAQACAPDTPEVVISDIATRLAVRLGISTACAVRYCDVGMLATTYPAITTCLATGAFSFAHMTRLADDLLAVPQAHRPKVDTTIATKVLTPTRACQAVPAVRCVHRRAQAIIAEICPPARPTDTDEVPTPPPPAGSLSIDTRDENTTTFHLTVDKPDAAELTAAITTTAAQRDLTTAEALIALIRGQVTTSVTVNLYAPRTNPQQLSTATAGLTDTQRARWVPRITHTRAVGWAYTRGYAPTDVVRAMVTGRDGTCRFPGCGVDAAECQIDHITRFDHTTPTGGGPTVTGNLHCLCAFHHRVKTSGQWDVTMAGDGTQVWTSHGDGHVVVTEPGGPLRRASFTHRATNRARILTDRNNQLKPPPDNEPPF